MNEQATDTLAAALARDQIEMDVDQVETLDRYCQLLWEWNEKINLTRHTSYEKFVARDVVDSLWLERFIDSGERVLDVGTGGGVPGIVLAIARPDLEVSLSESVAKKARVVEDIVKRLGINVLVHHGRAEELVEDFEYDTLVVRAVAPLAKLLTWFAEHWSRFRRLLIIKGPAWVEERGEARHRGLTHNLRLSKLASYPIDGAETESVVLEIRPKGSERE